MMKVEFHPEAELEFYKAVEYYQKKSTELAEGLLNEISKALDRIGTYPRACPSLEKGIRRCLINRFPYAILYRPYDETLYVLAVTHLRLPPEYWKDRLDS
jgi:plasmid stabilization system protein ParE